MNSGSVLILNAINRNVRDSFLPGLFTLLSGKKMNTDPDFKRVSAYPVQFFMRISHSSKLRFDFERRLNGFKRKTILWIQIKSSK